ncbi:hypothetical protein quinque_011154 [Culex quinquefasciatus]
MSLDSLPAEILQKIFDFLPSNEHLEKTRISRRWNQLALRETYLILAYGDQLISERLLRRTTRGYCCFSVEFSEGYEPVQSRFALCAQRFFLRKLILDGIQSYAMGLFVAEHASWVRSLVQLSVTVWNQIDSSGVGTVLELPRLRTLSWTFNTEGGSKKLPTFRIRAPLLEDAFVECAEVSASPLVFEDTRNLKSLGVFAPEVLGSMCPNGLQSLDCFRVYNSTNPFAWDYARLAMPRLKTLEISGCKLNDTSQAFIGNFPNLETLIVQTANENRINLSVLSRLLPKLKQLRLFDVKWTYDAGLTLFPNLMVLDINDTKPEVEHHEELTLSAPHLKTVKGTGSNLHSFKLTDYSTVKLMISYGPYINFVRPRLFASLMVLYLDVPCDRQDLLVTECIHQFPNLTRLTIVLHHKSQPVGLGGHLMAISFVQLRYLHLRNFDLDYQFLCGINKSSSIRTLILQDGTLTLKPQDVIYFSANLQHFYMQNVKMPKHVDVFPTTNPATELILSLPDGNVFSTTEWREEIIKSREDYVKELLF